MEPRDADVLVPPPPAEAAGSILLVAEDDPVLAPGPALELRRMAAGESVRERTVRETAWLLIRGEADVAAAGIRARVARASLFDGLPSVLHVAAEAEASLVARAPTEWAVIRASNPRAFEPRLFLPEECGREARGRGLAQGACEREVRLVFDRTIRPESALVLGEVLTPPGRWSSYPPHSHPQPEVYHYRFDLPSGYGHAECGERVFKVRSGHTLKIPPGLAHAQAAAPGYAMWYLWAVRHLAGRPYAGFDTDPEHAWVLDPSRPGWRPAS